ncbi:hypothetical protein [Enterococcus viikkiensis]|uniref:hypothetical protein n=1 Tax=Enterococcus viikkiensis TaxID=930854 RepID=UPI003F8F9BD9
MKIYPSLIFIKMAIQQKGRAAMIDNYTNVDNKLGFFLCMAAILIIGFLLVLFLCTLTGYLSSRLKNWQRTLN